MDLAIRKKQNEDRITELTLHKRKISDELDQPLPADLEDQAIDLEDDEVLEGIGHVNQQEVHLLGEALKRIADGSYGICQECGDAITEVRLDAVLYAQTCHACATTT